MGASANDTTDGGSGNATICGLAGADMVLGGPGDDTIEGSGQDRLLGGRGADNLVADGGLLRGGRGNDHLVANTGAAIFGVRGGDTIVATLTRRTHGSIVGGPGKEVTRWAWSASLDGRKVRIDLTCGRLSVRSERIRAGYGGIERTRTTDRKRRPVLVTFIGSPRADHLTVWRTHKVRAFGRGGNDHLMGGKRDDLLDGGPAATSWTGTSTATAA